MIGNNNVHELVREVQAIAQTGLRYSTDPFDQERYKRLRRIGSELISKLSVADVSQVERFLSQKRDTRPLK